ncbi:hypothetical protein AC1031_020784 [Aphanomyces cochlioides]|nr:hypothetical protein AC1031_020784 [Aphanomyces cochlioides]
MYQRWRQAGAHFLTNTGLAPTLAEFRAMDPLWLEIGNNSDKSCLAAAIRIVATNLNVSNFELSEEVISGFKEAHGVPQDAGIPPSKMHDFLKLAYTHGFHYNDAIFSRQLLKQSVGDPIRDICRAILDEPDGEFLVVSVTDSTSHCWVLAKRYKRCIDRSLCMIQDNENERWALLCASNLHYIWTTHNAAKFESKEPPPPEIWQEVSFIRWHASIRRWLRLQEVDSPQRVEAISAINTLHRQPVYRPLVAKYPTLLALQPSAPN